MEQKEYFGIGSINKLNNILEQERPKKIFLVTSKSSYEKSGAKEAIDPILNGYHITHFYDFETNPKLSDVEKGIKFFKENNCDFVIAVGGGSVIDIAKSINLFASNSSAIEIAKSNNLFPQNKSISTGELQREKLIEKKGNTLVVIPTTSGSGSEATTFAVIYSEKIKASVDHPFLFPDYAIIDPQFTFSLPSYITACTGMDALSQGIESYWCVNSTKESKKYAKEAIQLAINNLSIATNKPSKESREAMAKAANLAGKAINITRTTAPHAISYPITAYFNVPHGHAVGLTLPQVLIYNSQVTEEELLDKRGTEYVKKTIKEIVNLLGTNNVEDASNKIKDLMIEIGLKRKLSELGIKDEDVEIIVKRGFNPNRVNNNPRKLTEEALREFLMEIK